MMAGVKATALKIEDWKLIGNRYEARARLFNFQPSIFNLHFPMLFALVLALAVSPVLAGRPPAKDKLAQNPNQVRGDEITPQQQEAVKKGLAWLAAHQQRDG